MNSEDGSLLHQWYGPCDAMGPDGGCSACSGLIEGMDGALIALGTGRVVRRPPFHRRVAAAWRMLFAERLPSP